MPQETNEPKLADFNTGTKQEQLQKRVDYINKNGYDKWAQVIKDSRPQK